MSNDTNDTLDSIKNTLESNWKQLTGSVKEMWGELTDDAAVKSYLVVSKNVMVKPKTKLKKKSTHGLRKINTLGNLYAVNVC